MCVNVSQSETSCPSDYTDYAMELCEIAEKQNSMNSVHVYVNVLTVCVCV